MAERIGTRSRDRVAREVRHARLTCAFSGGLPNSLFDRRDHNPVRLLASSQLREPRVSELRIL